MKKILVFIVLVVISINGYSQQNSRLSQGLLLSVQSGANSLPGTNLIGDSEFTGNSWWDLGGAGLSISAGVCHFTSAGAYSELRRANLLTVGETYTISYTISGYTEGQVFIYTGTNGPIRTSNGVYTETFKAAATSFVVANGAVTSTFNVSHVYLRKINSTALTLPDPAYSLSNSGAIPTYGHKGNASYWAFDGVDDYIPLGSINLTAATTISTRFKSTKSTYGEYIFNAESSNNSIAIILGNATGGIPDESIYCQVIIGGSVVLAFSVNKGHYYYCDGVEHSVFVTLNGSNAIYVDGVLQTASFSTGSSSASYTGGSYPSYISSSSAGNYNFLGNIYSHRTWDYILDQAGVTYYSNPANHLKAVDQGATGAALNTDAWSNSANESYNYDTFSGASATGFTASTPSASGGYVELKPTGQIVSGKGYRIAYDLTVTSGTAPNIGTGVGSNLGTLTAGTGKTLDVTSAGTTMYLWHSAGTTANYAISNIALTQLGCLLDLTAEGMISPTLWRDYYHNVDIALSGATAPRLVKSGNLTGWRFNGTDSYLSITDAKLGTAMDLGIGDWSVTWWALPTRTNAYGCFVSKYTGAEDGFDFYTNTSGNYDFKVRPSGTSISSGACTIDTWVHLAITISSGSAKFYKDGVLIKTTSISDNLTNNADFVIGARNVQYSPDLFYMGVIEGLKFYRKTLSAEEIALDYATYQE